MDADPESNSRKPRVRLLTRIGQRACESFATARGIVAQPRTAPSIAREALVTLWRVRGGGFYGFGYVITFVVLEIRMLVGNAVGGGDVVTMVVQEILEILFRFAVQSFINGFIAFAWPIVVVNYLHAWGILGIAVAWVVFDRWAKPWINARLPDVTPQKREKRRRRRKKADTGPDVVPRCSHNHR